MLESTKHGEPELERKMAAVRTLAGGLAHEYNNMLAVIIGFTGSALERMDPGQEIYADLKEVEKAALRAVHFTRKLLVVAGKDMVSTMALNLDREVEKILDMLRQIAGDDIHLAWQPGKHSDTVKLDPSHVRQILTHLCRNARDAIHGAGKIVIETDTVTFDDTDCKGHEEQRPGMYVLLSFKDNGCGMDNPTLARVFEPFFTTKDVGEGSGLGFSMIYSIVKEANGYIQVSSEPDRGTVVKIYLPVYNGGR